MIRRNKVLYNDRAAGNGTWYMLDYRYEQDQTRSIQINMNASDTIEIQGTTLEANDATALDAIIDTADITTLQTYTGNTDENDVLSGPWTFIRAVKTGTNGVAKVQGQL